MRLNITGRYRPMAVMVALAAAISIVAPTPGPASASEQAVAPAVQSDTSTVVVYNPIIVAGNPNATSAWWAWGASTAPTQHHIVYSNWGFQNDWSLDVFARKAGRPIVTPFASKTNTGKAVRSTVVDIRPGCKSGDPKDGGHRVTIEATNTATGVVLARADVMHVDRVAVKKGTVLGPWTTIGYTGKWRQNSCYDVSSDWGIHVHLEVVNKYRYACWQSHAYQARLTGYSRLGIAGGSAYTGRRAKCR